jgi:hypothetical protein
LEKESRHEVAEIKRQISKSLRFRLKQRGVTVASLARAGAEHELGRRGDGVMQPMTMLFFLSHVNVPEAEQAKVLTRQPWNVVEPERLVGKVNSYRLDLARGVTISVLGPDGLQASARSDFQTPRDRS